ncbi:MAG: prolyl oligopeptidase family serine peptidase [Acidobacteriota bacterium]|nr:prolyl oligopeptidase family serine peptidase [Acidobacteriota bacterium]
MPTRRRFARRLLPVVVCLFAASAAHAQSFTIEQVLSSPFPSEPVASKRGDKLAWVFDAQGRRNVWIAEAPQWRGRQLTRYDADDGQELTELVFSEDGRYVAFTRGQEKNQAGESPNPTSDPAGAKQEVWVADTRTGSVTRMGEGSGPFFTRAGDAVIYSREDHLWSAPVVGGKERKLFEMRGGVNGAQWSPDGSSLVFSSARGDHAFVSLYDPRANKIRLIQPSIDRDISPRFSPDGRRIAFIRLYNVTDTQNADRERVQPWSIWVVDAATGEGKEIWKSGATWMESFSGGGAQMLEWGAGDQIVFASEMDGWRHLYSISASGGEPIKLTPGEYEVENVAVTPDRSALIFSSNRDDVDRRHLWRVDVAGGKVTPLVRGEGAAQRAEFFKRPTRITGGDGIEMYPVVIGGGRQVAFFHSTARDPLLPFVANVDGSNMRQIAPQALPKDFPSAQLAEPEQVIFKAADGVEIHGQLFKPKDVSGKVPALIFTHGGPIRQMLLGFHYLYYYHNAYAMNQYLASRGYEVLSVNYRSGIGYGRAFREAQHRGARGASEYQDVVAGAKYLRSRPEVDDRRIGLWGGSYGGYLTAMGLARNSDIFAAGVDFHGVHDWSTPVAGLRVALDSGERARLARESSPIASVDKWKSPVLLIHGDDDRNVAFAQTVMLVRRLRDQGVEFEQLIFPDEVHDFLRHDHWVQAYHATADFFDRHLKR